MSESSDSQRREQILRAAERLFQHYGFSKTTVADIARAAKVGVGSVYLEFPSKNDIVAALSFERYDRVLQAMRQAARGSGSCAERFQAMFDARVEQLLHVAQEGHHGMDLIRCACPAAEDVHARYREQEEELVTEFLAQAAAAHELDVAEPKHTARVLIRIYDCYNPIALSRTAPQDLRRDLAVTHTVVLRGLLKR